MMRGEVDGSCGMLESSLRGAFDQHLQAGELKIVVQFGRDRAVPYFGDATRMYQLLTSKEQVQVADVIFRQTELARPLAAPPGTPKERVAALRRAMLATLKDPALIDDAKRMETRLRSGLRRGDGGDVRRFLQHGAGAGGAGAALHPAGGEITESPTSPRHAFFSSAGGLYNRSFRSFALGLALRGLFVSLALFFLAPRLRGSVAIGALQIVVRLECHRAPFLSSRRRGRRVGRLRRNPPTRLGGWIGGLRYR